MHKIGKKGSEKGRKKKSKCTTRNRKLDKKVTKLPVTRFVSCVITTPFKKGYLILTFAPFKVTFHVGPTSLSQQFLKWLSFNNSTNLICLRGFSLLTDPFRR